MGKRKNPDESSETDTVSKKVTRRTMSNCKVCSEPIDLSFSDENTFNLLCRECKDRFHGNCVGISSKFFYNLVQASNKGWACYSCVQNKMQFLENVEDRVKKVENSVARNTSTIFNVQASVESALSAMNDQIQEVKRSLTLEVNSIKSSSAPNSASHSSLATSVVSNSSDIQYVKSLQRKNNLVIQNIPTTVGETQQSLKETVVKIASCYGYVLEVNAILVVVRLRGKPSEEELSGRDILERPLSNNLLVKFADASIKDDFFRNYIASVTQQKFITGAAIGFPAGQRIFINHHLSYELTTIKMKAAELKKSGLIDKISARYDSIKVLSNGIWHRVTNLDELNAIVRTGS